jgi:hypothetical protein
MARTCQSSRSKREMPGRKGRLARQQILDRGRSFTIAGATGLVQRCLDTAGLLQLPAPGADGTSDLPAR